MYHLKHRPAKRMERRLPFGTTTGPIGLSRYMMNTVSDSFLHLPLRGQVLADDPASAACGNSINLSSQVPFLPELPVYISCII